VKKRGQLHLSTRHDPHIGILDNSYLGVDVCTSDAPTTPAWTIMMYEIKSPSFPLWQSMCPSR